MPTAVIPRGMTECLLVKERSNNMRKKLATVLLCICMVLTLLPVSASAAGVTELWVGGVEIEVGSLTTGACDEGTVTYTASDNKLTLTNAKITGTHDFGASATGSSDNLWNACIFYNGDRDLTIELVGNNTITGQSAVYGSYGVYIQINNDAKLKFTGTGTLKVTSAAINCGANDDNSITHLSNPIYAYNGVEIGTDCTIVAASGGVNKTGSSSCRMSCCPIYVAQSNSLVLNETTAVCSTSVGGELIDYTNEINIDTVKYMKIGTGTVPNDPANTTNDPDDTDGQAPTPPTTPTTRPSVTITYANGTTVTAPKVGETLYASVTSVPDGVSITGYTWKLNDGNVVKANCGTDSTYTLMEDAEGLFITLEVSFSDDSRAYANSRVTVAAANSSTPTTPTTPNTPATGNHHRVFHVDAEKAESPKTADTGVMLYAALSLASLTGTAWWSKKRK